jgi:hypothetical protein
VYSSNVHGDIAKKADTHMIMFDKDQERAHEGHAPWVMPNE